MIILDKEKNERKTPNPFGKGDINPTNMQAVKWLKGVHPSFAKHIWERNGLVQAIAMERFGGVDMLDLPVCEKCEKPGAWHDNDSCYCFTCGHNTPKHKTKTLYRYIAEDSMPRGMSHDNMELLQKMLLPTISGALRDIFDNIENLDKNEYQTYEGEEEFEMPENETIDDNNGEDTDDEEIKTVTDNSPISNGEA